MRYRYNLDEWLNPSGSYITVSCTDESGRTASITTNRSGEGLFRWTGDHWQQLLGTCQYHLPHTAGGIRRRLRGVYAMIYREEA